MHASTLLATVATLTLATFAAPSAAFTAANSAMLANVGPDGQGAGCSFAANTDRPGFDLANTRGPINSCYAKCAATPNCQTFTWNGFNGGTCWLKSYGSRPIGKAGVSAYSCVLNKPTNVCSQYKDVDFVGMDIGSRRGVAGSCCDECAAFKGCTAYSWTNFNGGTCWLKKSVGQTVSKPGVISSSLAPLFGGVCAAESNVDFVGMDIGNKPSKDAGVCCGQCKATAGCKAYTWSNHNGGTCWMKNGKGKTVAKTGVTSGSIVF
jgi:hypothetical protein